ncbi:MAG: vitamin K epoxide reductase family protein [Desulforegulaceae bacterium]|nr:vitamin K epoxide reductase family protein [Desulforegulaceae bacterium]
MKNKIILCLTLVALFLAFYISIGDLFQIHGKIPLASSCETTCSAMHESSFGMLWGIPIAVFGFFGLLFFFIAKIKNYHRESSIILCGMLGFELYLIILQFFYFNSFCEYCILFAALILILSLLNIKKYSIKSAFKQTTFIFIVFLITHLFFFPPLFPNRILADGLPICMTDKAPKEHKTIEIFVSPDCPFCEKAVTEIASFISHQMITDSKIRIKHVGTSQQTRQEAIKAVALGIFGETSHTAYKMAECYVLQNQKELTALNNGKIETPFLVLKDGSEKYFFLGWNELNKKRLFDFLKKRQTTLNWDAFENFPNFDTKTPAFCPSGQKGKDLGICGS